METREVPHAMKHDAAFFEIKRLLREYEQQPYSAENVDRIFAQIHAISGEHVTPDTLMANEFYEQAMLSALPACEKQLAKDMDIDEAWAVSPFEASSNLMLIFGRLIQRMNEMYRLPVNTEPFIGGFYNIAKDDYESPVERISKFMKTMNDELLEGNDVMCKLQACIDDADSEEKAMAALVALSDWFADKVVYIFSEACKFGIPLAHILLLVMESNFTKLPSDGVPVYDENGKFLKDKDNYRAPEEAIATFYRETYAYHIS